MSNLKVLVVGASIAGPMSAYWLARAGASVTIIERFPKLRIGGQNVDIRTHGVSIMREIPGMEAAVKSKVMQFDGITIVDAKDKTCASIKPTGDPYQQSLVSEYEILRGDLSRILYDLTKSNENIKYIFGEQVTSIEHEKDDGPATVKFANGLATTKFDLIVGCDGASSRTRALGLGCGAREFINPSNRWAAYFSTKKDLLNEGKIGKAYSAIGGRFIAIGRGASDTNVTLINVYPRRKANALIPFRNAMKEGDNALRQYVAQQYKGAGWKCDEAMEGVMLSQDFHASEIVQVKVPNLHKGRFALVGDAGYAGAAGMGTTLAMVGAYILAGEISQNSGNLKKALKNYEEHMRPLIDELQGLQPLFPMILAPQTAWGLWIRNNIFRFVSRTGLLKFGQRFMANSFADTDKSKLPNYKWK